MQVVPWHCGVHCIVVWGNKGLRVQLLGLRNGDIRSLTRSVGVAEMTEGERYLPPPLFKLPENQDHELPHEGWHCFVLFSILAEFLSTTNPTPLKPPRGTIIVGIRLFSPLRGNEKKFVDELFRTGSVSHALRVMSPVPYSQHALCTKLGNCPTVWIFHLMVWIGMRICWGKNKPVDLYFDSVCCYVIWLSWSSKRTGIDIRWGNLLL